MASETPNYQLLKPDPNDFYDVNVANTNMDKIDTILKQLASAIASGATAEQIEELGNAIGNLEGLETETKTNLVAAINSLKQTISSHLAETATDEVRPHGMGTAAGKDVQASTRDESTGRLMQVGAFGLGGGSIGENGDLNTFLGYTNKFFWAGSGSGDGLANTPGNLYGHGIQFVRAGEEGSSRTQLFTDNGAGDKSMWFRGWSGSQWGPWFELFHEGNQPKLRVNNDVVEYLDDNTWKPISKGGLLPGFNGLLYYSGEEHIQFDVGYKTGTATQSKNADCLLLQPSSSTGECAYVTSIEVDLTNVNTLKVDWEQSYADNNTYSYLIVSTSKTGNFETYNARTYVRGQFARKIDTLDVSNLTGTYYIRVAARRLDTASSSPSHKIYRIWGE
ncbi:pyocin knob domain-containing protein [Peptococcaceae bacterium 1198_IL3148]